MQKPEKADLENWRELKRVDGEIAEKLRPARDFGDEANANMMLREQAEVKRNFWK